jgi:hypothetical protein
MGRFYGFDTNKFYRISLDGTSDIVIRVKHKVHNFRAEANFYNLSKILSYMTPSTVMRDSFTGNRFLSSLSSSSPFFYSTSHYSYSPLKSDFIN